MKLNICTFRPLLISSCIFPEDEKSETICKLIVETLKEKASLLDQWIVVHEAMFDTDHDIPSANAIHLFKLWDGVVTTDTCNAARLLSSLIRDAVIEAVGEKLRNDGQDSDLN